MNILIIEDSVRLADTIQDALKKENYIAKAAYDGQSGYETAVTGIFDLIILDLMLPKMNGYEVLSALRADGCDTPVLILSAKTTLDDKLRGFTVGADDYITKPFDIPELLMRIQAITRRASRMSADSLLHLADLSFDPHTGEMKNTDTGKQMQLSGKELSLLTLFMNNTDQILEKEQITTRIWGYDSNAEYNNVEVYVSFLRRKFKHLGVSAAIRTVRGVGYIMEVTE